MSSFENYTGRYHGMEIEAVEGFFGSYQFTGKSFLFLNKIIAKKKKNPLVIKKKKNPNFEDLPDWDIFHLI